MNEILYFLEQNHIDGKFIENFLGCRYVLKIYDFEIIVKHKEGLTLQEFKDEFNSQYLVELKNKARFYSSMAQAYREQVDNFEPVFI